MKSLSGLALGGFSDPGLALQGPSDPVLPLQSSYYSSEVSFRALKWPPYVDLSSLLKVALDTRTGNVRCRACARSSRRCICMKRRRGAPQVGPQPPSAQKQWTPLRLRVHRTPRLWRVANGHSKFKEAVTARRGGTSHLNDDRRHLLLQRQPRPPQLRHGASRAAVAFRVGMFASSRC